MYVLTIDSILQIIRMLFNSREQEYYWCYRKKFAPRKIYFDLKQRYLK